MTSEEIAIVLKLHADWLAGRPGGQQADLSSAALRGANLQGADLTLAVLEDADLEGADLSGARLGGANLTNANLRGANLRGANLVTAVLFDADLTNADVREAQFRGYHLRGARLKGALMGLKVDPVPNFRSKLLEAVERPKCRVDMGNWHTCETVHCLAGWVVTIHPQGRELEQKLNTPLAAAFILSECGESVRISSTRTTGQMSEP